MIEFVLGFILLLVSLGIIIKVTTPCRAQYEERPKPKQPENVEPLERALNEKVEQTTIGISQLMNELRTDEERTKSISESDTMRSIRHKVDRLKNEV